MLIVALTIWLTLIVFFVVLCRAAASGDGRDLASAERYPSAKARGARGRAERYAAGS
jgi:hypothetical protein